MEEYKNKSLEELRQIKEALEKEKESLKMRRADVNLYQQLYERYYGRYFGFTELLYGKLCDHPEYYTKWRNTFFDKYNRLIHNGIYTRYSTEPTGLSIPEKKDYRKKNPKKYKLKDSTSNILSDCRGYTTYCKGINTFDSLLRSKNNPNKHVIGKDLDTLIHILGYCNAVREIDGRYQLHLVDPSGECTFPPFDITAEEAEIALGRICIVTCVYNYFYTGPKLWELQILPFTLTEKLGEYETDTVIIERNFPINLATTRDLF